MYSIELKDVYKSFGDVEVISGLNLKIKKGERLVLLGPSGCGKSTVLRMISGLEELSDGELLLNGERANEVESGERSIAMVFQNYALYPHMTVYENVEYGMKMNKVPEAERSKRIQEALKILNLEGYEGRYPRELSGGQRQRVALSRALVKESDFFLLDEPLSNLDAQLRGQARKELVKIHDLYKQTFIYVTHDQIEAMTIGHRIALLNEGKLQMLDTPKNVYHKPANVFTAKFIGSPPMNVFEAFVLKEGLEVDGHFISYEHLGSWSSVLKDHEGPIYMGIRPEKMLLSNQKSEKSLSIQIDYFEDYGNRVGFYFEIAGEEVIATSESVEVDLEQAVFWEIEAKHLHFFDQKSEENLGYPEGV